VVALRAANLLVAGHKPICGFIKDRIIHGGKDASIFIPATFKINLLVPKQQKTMFAITKLIEIINAFSLKLLL